MFLIVSGNTISYQSWLRVLPLPPNCFSQVHIKSHLSSETGQVWRWRTNRFTIHLAHER